MADYSSESTPKTQEIKQEDASVPTVKTSLGTLDWWSRLAISSAERVLSEVDMARRENGQPTMRYSRLNKDWAKESKKVRKTVVEMRVRILWTSPRIGLGILLLSGMAS